MLAGRQVDRELPRDEGVRPQRLRQRRLVGDPVHLDLDPGDLAAPGDTRDAPVLGRGHERRDRQLVELRPVRDPVRTDEAVVVHLERAVERLGRHDDRAEPLDGVDRVVARDDRAERAAELTRDRLAVERPGDEHGSVQGLADRDRPGEALVPGEHDLDGGCVGLRLGEHSGERGAAPAALADRALLPREAVHGRVELHAAMAGALEHHVELHPPEPLQVRQVEPKRRRDGARDLDGARRCRGNREMVPPKMPRRRGRPAVERGQLRGRDVELAHGRSVRSVASGRARNRTGTKLVPRPRETCKSAAGVSYRPCRYGALNSFSGTRPHGVGRRIWPPW